MYLVSFTPRPLYLREEPSVPLYLVMLYIELMLLLGNGSVFRFVVRSKVVTSAGYRTECLCVTVI